MSHLIKVVHFTKSGRIRRLKGHKLTLGETRRTTVWNLPLELEFHGQYEIKSPLVLLTQYLIGRLVPQLCLLLVGWYARAVGLCPGPNVINILRLLFTNFRNKLECLSLAGHSSLV